MAQGGVSSKHPAYRTLLLSMNGLLHFADDLSSTRTSAPPPLVPEEEYEEYRAKIAGSLRICRKIQLVTSF